MESNVEQAAMRLLRECSVPTLPMRRLHAMVVAEVGAHAGSYARFRDIVRRRRDLFLVIEPDDPLGEAGQWPQLVRAEYQAALLAAGLEADPIVVLATAAAAHDPFHDDVPDSLAARLGASLVELLDRSRNDPGLANAIQRAVGESSDLAQTIAVPTQSRDATPRPVTYERRTGTRRSTTAPREPRR